MISIQRISEIKKGDVIVWRSGKNKCLRTVLDNNVEQKTLTFKKLKQNRYKSPNTIYSYYGLTWIIKGIYKLKINTK